MIKKSKTSTRMTRDVDVEYMNVGDDLFLMKQNVSWKAGEDNDNLPENTTKQGFVDSDNLMQAMRGQKFEIDGTFILLDKDLIEVFRQEGFAEAFSKHRADEKRNKIFDKIQANPSRIEDLHKVSFSDHQIYRLDGSPVSMAIQFDYISAGMNSRKYDLEKAVEHLLSRDDVTLRSNRYSPNDYIELIPHYNNDSGHDKSISFTWHPSDEDYAEVFRDMKRVKHVTYSEIFEVVFEKDILGLREAGAALYEGFYDETEHVPDDDDYSM